MESKKILVIHHDADMDGLTSGMLASLVNRLNNNMTILGYNYQLEPKDGENEWLNFKWFLDNKFDEIQFIDVTPPIKWFENLRILKDILPSLKIKIYDHHEPVYHLITKLDSYQKFLFAIKYHFSPDMCGALIYQQKYASKYLILDSIQTFLFNVSEYDTWAWSKNNNQTPVAINEYMLQFKTVQQYLDLHDRGKFGNSNLPIIIEKGFEFIDFKRIQAENTKHLLHTFDGDLMVIINDKANNSHIEFIKQRYLSEPIKGVIFYKDIDFINETINVSVRSIAPEFDCKEFVQKISSGLGGGHKGSAGVQMSFGLFLSTFSYYVD